ncbi:MAG: glutamine--fructose-6-phosphate transaminase (isomerizing) [Actinomycetaceae bacterium]|nr:glutamine--fructose-6-phosphate transaminase (isomerizing) [Actinomycetaceae bacterium]
MCGIVGHVGAKDSDRSLQVVLDGLSRLEYRGYDSAGVAVGATGGLNVVKSVGKLANLKAELEKLGELPGRCAIGHTRWATHGIPSVENAHPHTSLDGALALVHNGIIENATALRQELTRDGFEFVSDTDTEVVVHLLARTLVEELRRPMPEDEGVTGVAGDPSLGGGAEDAAGVAQDLDRNLDHDQAATSDAKNNSLLTPGIPADSLPTAAALTRAMRRIMSELHGTFTLLAVHEDAPGVVVAARRSSPLVIGLGEGENFLGSDALAFAQYTRRAIEVGQDELAVVTPTHVTVLDIHGNRTEPKTLEVDFSADRATKDGWPTFMEKEINEQPRAIADTLANRLDAEGFLTLDELRIPAEVLRTVDKMVIIACGTAAYAGQVARYAIEHWCRIPVEVELAHEFRYRDPVVTEKTLVVAISQSGETMDTIMAIRHAREQGAKVVAVVNTPGSTISRESDAVLLTHAGPEIAVASTKAFTAQITATYILGLYLAQVRGNKFIDEIQDYLDKLAEIPAKVEDVISRGEGVRQAARMLADTASVIFLGRHVGFPVAMEGALKLKELAYIHAEGFAAGELKHGPIALIEDGQPVIIVVPTPRRPELHRKVVSNIQEVRARGARTLVIAEDGDEAVNECADVVFRVPPAPTLYAPLLAVVPLQIFACELATAKGLDVDQPRNLAKSVTVE